MGAPDSLSGELVRQARWGLCPVWSRQEDRCDSVSPRVSPGPHSTQLRNTPSPPLWPRPSEALTWVSPHHLCRPLWLVPGQQGPACPWALVAIGHLPPQLPRARTVLPSYPHLLWSPPSPPDSLAIPHPSSECAMPQGWSPVPLDAHQTGLCKVTSKPPLSYDPPAALQHRPLGCCSLKQPLPRPEAASSPTSDLRHTSSRGLLLSAPVLFLPGVPALLPPLPVPSGRLDSSK